MAHFSQQRKISDILIDKNEFPSLSEVSKKSTTKDCLESGRTVLSFSDRLKTSHPAENVPKKFSIGAKTFSEFIPGVPVVVETSENTFSKSACWTAKPIKKSSTEAILKETPLNNQRVEAVSNAWARVVSTPLNPKRQPHLPNETAFKPNKMFSTNCKPNNPSPTNKETHKKDVSTECEVEGGVKKKRKRKSKVKRQAAMKSGKISLVTAEIHSKIINETKYSNHSVLNDVSTNIHDVEEYPELGKMVDVRKVNPDKRNIHSEKKNFDLEQFSDNTENAQGVQKTLEKINSFTVCKEAENNQKSVVHPKDPITISFLDILTTSKPKVKENQERRGHDIPAVPSKMSSKTIPSQPHNLLDSKPVAKRGKERDIPKAKKPSQMKKIILLDRKTRKEQLVQLKNNLNEIKQDLPLFAQENNTSAMNNSGDCASDAINNVVSLPHEENVIYEKVTVNIENSTNKITSEAEDDIAFTHEDEAGLINSEDEFNNPVDLHEDPEERNFLLPPADQNETVKLRNSQITDALTLKHIQMLNSMFGLTMSLKDVDLNKSSCFSDEERLNAARILIHTRNFREYCNHLPSQEIDDAVNALLSDLVRFQDRMHQKDPVKARVKRRLICGIREVKKHLKLRKVKCVILPTDVENIQTEGGLNDVLCDLKQAAADHQIPCVFALRKRKLGKLCHKPVAVSCIGIFNYEGSEVNFKKMMELLNESKADYEQILKGVMAKLSDDDMKQLLKARLTAPESLMEIRTDILRKTLLENPKIEDMPNVNVAVEK